MVKIKINISARKQFSHSAALGWPEEFLDLL
jgi:hypothetical protein